MLNQQNSLYRQPSFWLVTLLWLVAVVFSFYFQPFQNDTDQLHYLSVAWEMWRHQHYLFAISGGLPDNNKPPLLYWLMMGGWKLFGVSNLWPRVLQIIIGFLCIQQAARLTKRVSHSTKAQWIVYLFMYGSYYWWGIIFQIRFDALFTLFTLISIVAIWDLYNRFSFGSMLSFVLALTLGYFTKGPYLLIYALPIILLFPAIHNKRRYWVWYGVMISLTALSFVPFIVWLHYVQLYLAHTNVTTNIANKVSGYLHLSFQFPMYVISVVYVLVPWVAAVPLWLALRHIKWQQHKIAHRFLAVLIISGLFFPSLLMPHYAIRYIMTAILLFTALLAMVIAEYNDTRSRYDGLGYTWFNVVIGAVSALFFLIVPLICHHVVSANFSFIGLIPWWFAVPCIAIVIYQLRCCRLMPSKQLLHAAIGVIALWMVYQAGFWQYYAPHFSVIPAAQTVSRLQQQGHPVLMATSRLEPQRLEFLGRFDNALPLQTDSKKIAEWARQHPNGYIIFDDYYDAKKMPTGFIFTQPSVSLSGRNLFKKKKLKLIAICGAKSYLKGDCG